MIRFLKALNGVEEDQRGMKKEKEEEGEAEGKLSLIGRVWRLTIAEVCINSSYSTTNYGFHSWPYKGFREFLKAQGRPR